MGTEFTAMSDDEAGYDVAMIGLGYIGLPTAAVMARAGMRVRGVDVRPQVVETVNSARVHIEEKDLDALVRDVVGRGLLSASTEPPLADVFVIAVPTPFGENHEPDLGYVMAALEMIAPQVRPGNCIVLESTSPVGTTRRLAERLAQLRPDLAVPGRKGVEGRRAHDIHIAY